MATTAATVPTLAPPRTAEQTGFWSWVGTTDHKRIGILYLITISFFFLMGRLRGRDVSASRSPWNRLVNRSNRGCAMASVATLRHRDEGPRG